MTICIYDCIYLLYLSALSIYLTIHLPTNLTIYSHVCTHISFFQVCVLINSSYFAHNSQFIELMNKNTVIP